MVKLLCQLLLSDSIVLLSYYDSWQTGFPASGANIGYGMSCHLISRAPLLSVGYRFLFRQALFGQALLRQTLRYVHNCRRTVVSRKCATTRNESCVTGKSARCTNVVHDLNSAEPGSPVTGDLSRVQVKYCLPNLGEGGNSQMCG